MKAKIKSLLILTFCLSSNLCLSETNENLNFSIDATKSYSEKLLTAKSLSGSNETFSMQSKSGQKRNLFCSFMFSRKFLYKFELFISFSVYNQESLESNSLLTRKGISAFVNFFWFHCAGFYFQIASWIAKIIFSKTTVD